MKHYLKYSIVYAIILLNVRAKAMENGTPLVTARSEMQSESAETGVPGSVLSALDKLHSMLDKKTEVNNKQMLATLSKQQGPAFDKEFIDHMIKHHRQGIKVAKLALTNAASPKIKRMAKKIILSQQDEIEKLKSWQMYGTQESMGSHRIQEQKEEQ